MAVTFLLGAGCSSGASTPDAEVVDTAVDVTHDVDVVLPSDAPDATSDAATDDRPERDDSEVGAVDDGPSAGDVEDATHDIDVVLPEDATHEVDVVLPDDATHEVDVARPTDDATPDTDVVLPTGDAAAMDATPVVDAPDTDLGPPADAVFDASPAVDACGPRCESLCHGDDECDPLHRCDREQCEPRWTTCPGAPLPLDGGVVRVDPSTLGAHGAYIPPTGCGAALSPRAAAVFSLALTAISDVQLRVTGLPADARVELRNGCDDRGVPFGACGAGGFDHRLRAVPAGTWFVIVEASAITAPFEVSATLLPRTASEAELCPGVEIVPDTSGAVIHPATLDYRASITASGCASAFAVDWAARFTLTETRDVSLRAEFFGARPSQFGMILTSPCGQYRSGECGTTLYRSVPPGEYSVLGYQGGNTPPVRVSVSTAPPNTGRAVGDYCPTAAVVTPNGPAVTVNLAPLDRWVDLGVSCATYAPGRYGVADAVWRFTLRERSDVRLWFSGGVAAELRRGCGVDAPRVGACLYAREARAHWIEDLAPGEYSVVAQPVLSIGSAPGDVTVRVDAAPRPRPRALGDACDEPLPLPLDGSPVSVTPEALDPSLDLGTIFSRQDLGRGWGDAVWRFTLARRSDVTLTFATTPRDLSWQLQSRCGVGEGVVLGNWTDTSRTFRALAPGDYFVVAAWPGVPWGSFSLRGSAVDSPARAPGDTCADPIPLTPDAAPVTLDRRTLTGTEHGPRAMTQTRFVGDTARDVVFRYEHPVGAELVAEVSGPAGPFMVEQRSACDDGDSVVGPSAHGGSYSPISIPLRRAADGVGYLVVGAYLPSGSDPAPLTVAIRRTTASTAPGVVASAAPASVVWTNACDLPGAVRVLRRAREAVVTLPLPFALRYFGREFPVGHPVRLSSTGFLSFDPVPIVSPFPSAPTGVGVATRLGAFTDTGAEGVCAALVGDAPNRRWVVSWSSLQWVSGLPLRSEVMLHERGTIDVLLFDHYGRFDESAGVTDPAGRFTPLLDFYALSFGSFPHAAVRFDPVP